MDNVRMKDIPILDRPVERLLLQGASTLNNEELLAILLKTGTRTMSAKGIASQILKEMNDIRDLKNISLERLQCIKGIGPVKATTILALVELSKRMNRKADTILYKKFTSTDQVFAYYKEKLENTMQEHFYAIYLDSQKYVIKEKLLFMGTLNYSMVHPREIFKEALTSSAATIICLHNHPSGNCTPSKEDILLTNRLSALGKEIGVPIIDHIIVGSKKYYSFFENDKI